MTIADRHVPAVIRSANHIADTISKKKRENDEPKRETWLVGLTANDDLKTLLTDSLLTVIIGNGD